MKAVLVDDEELALEVLKRLLLKVGDIQITGMYTNPNEVKVQISSLEADVIFLDLEMGSIHGLQLAEEFEKQNKPVEIVFITAHSQFALEAFEVNAVDYLLKPVSLERLNKTIDKLRKRIVTKTSTEAVNTPPDVVLYLRTLGNYRLQYPDGSLIKWRTKKEKELFAYLWHQKKQPIHRDRIIEELWRDSPADKAAVLLHTTVYQLRKTLKSANILDGIRYINEHYLLEIPINSDLEELLLLLQKKARSSSELNKMIALYEGDYFGEEDYSWAFFSQQKYRQELLKVFEKFVIIERQYNCKSVQLENCLNKMLQMDFYNEEYVIWLLEYYNVTENRKKFLQVYEKYSIRIKQELGLNLSRKVMELYKNFITTAINK
jgi:two-component SAPR family response regulator